MEIRVLKYFLTVAREESISRAAEVLHLTQPTLSRQLAQLEEETGVQLFKRGGTVHRTHSMPYRHGKSIKSKYLSYLDPYGRMQV